MMEYKDDDGNILYGYSQIDLKNNTKAIERQTKTIRTAVMIGGSIAVAFFLLCIFILNQIMKYDILTNIVNRCVC